MSVRPWFAQPADPLGTAVLLPGRWGGVATPLMHWPASLLTQAGWSVLAVEWETSELTDPSEASVRRRAESALTDARPGLPVLVLAKSLGTLAMTWAVESDLPGIWLTPLLSEPGVVEAAGQAEQPTLLAGGTADPYWQVPQTLGPGVEVVEISHADHGLQTEDWRQSLAHQFELLERISRFAAQVLDSSAATPSASP